MQLQTTSTPLIIKHVPPFWHTFTGHSLIVPVLGEVVVVDFDPVDKFVSQSVPLELKKMDLCYIIQIWFITSIF